MKGLNSMGKFFTKEECQEAKDANLVELLNRLGVPLKKSGHEYMHAAHDSLKINEKNGWKWFSQDKKGNAVDYLILGPDFNYTYYEAVAVIRTVMGLDQQRDLGFNNINTQARTSLQAKKERIKTLVLPPKNDNNKRVLAYLNRTRGIDYKFINHCIKNGSLYESAEKHNAVFVGKDFAGNERYACQRGTYTFTSTRFSGDVDGADKSYNFRVDGNNKTLRVFEAPIDLLSYLTLFKMAGQKCEDTLLSLGCASLDALDTYLQESTKEIEIISVCTDNDSAGKRCYNNIVEKYADKYEVLDDRPKGLIKDYNELLVTEIELSKGFVVERELASSYVCTLPEQKQEQIRHLLNKTDVSEAHKREAMNGRVCDLENTITIKYQEKQQELTM